MTIAVAPFSFQSGKLEPYITLRELTQSATGAAVDWGHLLTGADSARQQEAAQEIIWRASAIADLYTLGTVNNTTGTLNATENKEGGWYRPDRQGRFFIHPGFKPIIAVTAFSYGQGGGNNQLVIPVSNDNVVFDEEQFIVTQWGPTGIQFGSLSQVIGGYGARPEVWCQYTYLCGYANSFLTADATAGDTSLDITDPTGMQPGQPYMLWDAPNNEQALIDTSYDGVSSTVPLASPLQFNHAAGVNFSALPLAVKQACIHLCCALVKERGQFGVSLASTGGFGGMVTSKAQAGENQDYIDAFDLLDPFRPTWGKL